MRKSIRALVAAWILGPALTASASQTTNPVPEPLAPLQAITIANADKLQLPRTLEIPGYKKGSLSQCSVAFSPDGRLLVAACGQNQVPVWDVQSASVRCLLHGVPQHIVACAFSPDGEILACGGFDRTITLWSPLSGERIGPSGSCASPIWELDWSPDGQSVVSSGFADGVRLWDVRRSALTWAAGPASSYLSVAFDPTGNTVAYGSRWDGAGVLDARTGEALVTLRQPHNPVGDVAFSPDGKLLAAGSHDKTVGIWDVAGQRLLKKLEGHSDVVLRAAFSPDGTLSPPPVGTGPCACGESPGRSGVITNTPPVRPSNHRWVPSGADTVEAKG